MTREEAIQQLEWLKEKERGLEGREGFCQLCDILVDLIKTWIVSGRDPFGAVVRRGGRPMIGDRPLTNAERCRRYRERKRMRA